MGQTSEGCLAGLEGMRIISAKGRRADEPRAKVVILDLVLADDVNGWRHEVSLVGTRRGIVFNFLRKDKVPKIAD